MARSTNHRSSDIIVDGQRLPVEVERSLELYAADPERIDLRLAELEREWSIERVIEANASVASMAGLCMGASGKKAWYLLPAAALGFLLERSLRGGYPRLPILRRLGFRTQAEIDGEEWTLKALRGDFRRLGAASTARLGEAAISVSAPGNRVALPDVIAEGAVPREELEEASRRKPRAGAELKGKEKGKRKPWYRRVLTWVLIGIVLLVIALRLAAAPIAEHFARSALQNLKGYSGDFREFSLGVLSPGMIVHDLSVDKLPPSDPAHPFAVVKRAEVKLSLKQLLRGRLVATAKVIEPRFHIVMATEGKAAEKDATGEPAEAPPPPPEVPDIASALGSIIPFRIDRVEIQKGEMVVVDASAKGRPEIRIGEIEATVENIETGTQLGNGRPSVFAARAKVQDSGELTIFYTANLLAKALTFAGQAKIHGLKLTEINSFIAAKSGLKVTEGEFDVFTAFTATNGKITGGVKPLLKHAEVESVSDDILAQLRAGLIDTAIFFFSDRVLGRKAVAALIPFQGEVSSPTAEILPTVLSVIRNAFVEGLASGFAYLPPPRGKVGSFLSRITSVFSKDEGPPKAEGPPEGGAR